MIKLIIKNITDFFDENIDVYYLQNDKYLVRDSKENIQFEIDVNNLSLEYILNDISLFDDIFFEKISTQNQIEDEILEKNDSFYTECLLKELDRIINHCKYSYKEFENTN